MPAQPRWPLAAMAALMLAILLLSCVTRPSGTSATLPAVPAALALRNAQLDKPLICPGATPAASYVGARGTDFAYQGQALHLSGYTFYPALNGGSSAWHSASFSGYIDRVLALAARAGLNLARPTDFWSTSGVGQRWDDPTLWANLDHLVCAAASQHTFVVMDLSAFKWLLVSLHLDPYNAANWTLYLDTIGHHFADQPAIAFYSISGEPPAPTTPAQVTALVGFYRAVTDELAAADGKHHLIAAGGFNHMEEETPATPWWQEIYALPNNTVVAFKTYSNHDLALLPAIAAYAAKLRKPLVDEEFGMPQSLGDAVFSGASYNGIAMSRAQFFQAVYQGGDGVGVHAFIFWNLGCQIKAQGYDVGPETPAVWQVIQQFAANAPTPGAPAQAGCPLT